MAEPDSTSSPASSEPNERPLLAGPISVRSAAITGLFLIAAFAVLAQARTLFLPLVLAFLAQFALSPAVRSLARLGVPNALGATLVLASVLGLGGAALTLGADPAARWIERLPANLSELRSDLQTLREPIKEVVEATEDVKAEVDRMAQDRAPTVAVREDDLITRVVTQTGSVVVTGAVVLVLLFFLLASGDSFLRKVVTILPTFRDKRRATEGVRRVESDLSRYAVSVTAINFGLGVCITGALWLAGMPEPWLWGALAGVLNFVPFLGASATALILTLAAVAEFSSLAQVALVVGVSVAINALEGLVVTPAILGHRMTMSPFAVLVSILLWSWLWGIPGAFVAVPILVVLKVVLDAFPRLRPIGMLLERDAASESSDRAGTAVAHP